ncbi:MAG TPA: polysaccharide deacetylase family protein [Clostridiaceae bacterium]|nr:polysaccharide deacetylase family protein [Clostridiaceae bacterium]
MGSFFKSKVKIISAALALGMAGAILLGACSNEDEVEETTTSSDVTTSTTTIETTPPTEPGLSERIPIEEMTEERYADLSNELQRWWYRVPEPLHQGVRAGIDDDIASLIGAYNAVWQLPPGKKTVYITMDEGYEMEGATPKILDTAKEKDFKIHFFITSGYIEDQPELVQRMVDEDHIVCNHSVWHKNAAECLDEEGVAGYIEEIRGANESFKNLTGQDFAPFFRPPEGAYSERALAVARDLGYYDVFWSFAYRDWVADEQPDPDEAMDKIMGQLHDGSVMLLHANSLTNAHILGDLVDRIRAEGYTIGSLTDELPAIAAGLDSTPVDTEEPAVGEVVSTTTTVTENHPTAAPEPEVVETTTTAASVAEQPAAETSDTTYVVQAGDTLWDIAVKLYPDEDPIAAMEAIAAANDEDDFESMYIFEGTPIQLP